jgi:hypothetical protein
LSAPEPPRPSSGRWPIRLGGAIGLIVQRVDADRARSGTSGYDDPRAQDLRTTSAELLLSMRLGERFGLRAYLPWIDRTWRRALPGGVEEGRIEGAGDALIEATGLAVRHVGGGTTALLTAIVGLKLPTGSSSELDHEGQLAAGQTTSGGHVHHAPGVAPALVHPHDISLGTGSWDAVLGAAAFARAGRLYGTARSLYALRTGGRGGFHAGDEVSWGGGPGLYLMQRGQATLGLLANVTGEIRARDRIDGQTIDDTGGTELFVGPDLQASWRGLSGEAGVDLPVLQRLNGLQLAADYRAHLGVNWAF